MISRFIYCALLSWLVCLNSVHEDVDKAIGHLAIARVRAEAEHLGHVGVVSGHAGDGRDDGAGIALRAKRPHSVYA